jgi:hypothetical protein
MSRTPGPGDAPAKQAVDGQEASVMAGMSGTDCAGWPDRDSL